MPTAEGATAANPQLPADRRALPRGVQIAVLVLLAIPTIAILLVPVYARSGPELKGWPFFYWYQVLWIPLSAVFIGAAYLLVQRARSAGPR